MKIKKGIASLYCEETKAAYELVGINCPKCKIEVVYLHWIDPLKNKNLHSSTDMIRALKESPSIVSID